jgi:hypothetical protein
MKGKAIFNQKEADAIKALISQKVVADTTTQKKLRDKIRAIGFYASDFGIGGGYTVEDFLSVISIDGKTSTYVPRKVEARKVKETPAISKRTNSDEAYIIALCDEVLQQESKKQHRFEFLKGDSGTRLPVDVYYPELNLVIEYCERQHTEEVKFFNRRQTVSGVSRGEQRKIYDQRRREVLPKHGLVLIEFDYSEFDHDRNKQLVRNREHDIQKVKFRLTQFLRTKK